MTIRSYITHAYRILNVNQHSSRINTTFNFQQTAIIARFDPENENSEIIQGPLAKTASRPLAKTQSDEGHLKFPLRIRKIATHNFRQPLFPRRHALAQIPSLSTQSAKGTLRLWPFAYVSQGGDPPVNTLSADNEARAVTRPGPHKGASISASHCCFVL